MAEIVLVQGAGTGGWLWDLEAEILRRRSRVTAPTFSEVGDRLAEGGPETSLSTHIDNVIGCLPDHAAAGLVLVGFSYGGLVAAGVVDRIPERVAMLVYLDAFVPVPGRSMFDLMPASMRASLQAAAESSGGGWQMPPIPLERLGPLGAIGTGVDISRLPELLLVAVRIRSEPMKSPPAPGTRAPYRCRRCTSRVGRMATTIRWSRSSPPYA